LPAAVHAAAALAKLAAGYRVSYLEAEPKGWARILASLPSAWARTLAADLGLAALGGPATAPVLDQVRRDLSWLGTATDASGRPQAYAHCLCAAP
jgi:hypothetical protein